MIDNGLWLIVSTVLLIVLLIIFPVMNIMEKQDAMIQIQIMDDLDFFVRDIKTQGQLTKPMYEQFSQKLAAYGNHFKIDMIHQKKQYVPVYEDPTDTKTFTGRMQAVYEVMTHREIVDLLYSADNADQVYYFNQGDYITVSLSSTLKSKATQIRDMLWSVNTDAPSYYMRLSGMIAHEAR